MMSNDTQRRAKARFLRRLFTLLQACGAPYRPPTPRYMAKYSIEATPHGLTVSTESGPLLIIAYNAVRGAVVTHAWYGFGRRIEDAEAHAALTSCVRQYLAAVGLLQTRRRA